MNAAGADRSTGDNIMAILIQGVLTMGKKGIYSYLTKSKIF